MRTSVLGPLAALLFSSLGAAAPVDGTVASPTSQPFPFASAYPICGMKGSTEEPGDHDMGPLEGKNMTLQQCRQACIRNGTCKAVSYAKVYSLCSFYSDDMKCDQLIKDATSFFVHYDNACPLK